MVVKTKKTQAVGDYPVMRYEYVTAGGDDAIGSEVCLQG